MKQPTAQEYAQFAHSLMQTKHQAELERVMEKEKGKTERALAMAKAEAERAVAIEQEKAELEKAKAERALAMAKVEAERAVAIEQEKAELEKAKAEHALAMAKVEAERAVAIEQEKAELEKAKADALIIEHRTKMMSYTERLNILSKKYQHVLQRFPHIKAEFEAMLLPDTQRDYSVVELEVLAGLPQLEKLLHRLDSVTETYQNEITTDFYNTVISAASLYDCSHANSVFDKTIKIIEHRHFIKSAFNGWKKHGLQGEVLDVFAPKWAALTDEKTGLMWAVNWDNDRKDSFPNRGGLTWYRTEERLVKETKVIKEKLFSSVTEEVDVLKTFADGHYNQGDNTQTWINKVNEKGWCGYHDWYLPTKDELETLLIQKHGSFDRERYYMLFTESFGSSSFWSSSPHANDRRYALAVGFYNSFGNYDDKGSSRYVRLVRSSQ